MIFSSDNWAGASAPVSEALTRHASGLVPAYGSDPLTEAVSRRFSEIFERDVAVFFVATGTAANALALSAYARPGGVVFSHSGAHIQVDECGAPEFFTGGGKLRGLAGANGKITPEALSAAMADHPDGNPMHGQVSAVSISQATECGTVYRSGEIRALADAAHGRGIPLHMDGARFANAVSFLGLTPAEVTWKAGVDVLSFGATKNGCWCAEAVVFFNSDNALQFPYLRKRAGHLLSKSRFAAAQFDGYLADGHWLANAAHANGLAQTIGEGLVATGYRLAWPVEANEVFPVLPHNVIARLRAAGAMFYEWPADSIGAEESAVRLVTSFATDPADVARFLELAAG
ncbi:MAG: threonine aldolase family protein [Pannonibacter sp.]